MMKAHTKKVNFIMQVTSDPYVVPKSMGIFQMLESPKDITSASIAQRIIANRDIYLVFIVYFFYLMNTYFEYKRT